MMFLRGSVTREKRLTLFPLLLRDRVLQIPRTITESFPRSLKSGEKSEAEGGPSPLGGMDEYIFEKARVLLDCEVGIVQTLLKELRGSWSQETSDQARTALRLTAVLTCSRDLRDYLLRILRAAIHNSEKHPLYTRLQKEHAFLDEIYGTQMEALALYEVSNGRVLPDHFLLKDSGLRLGELQTLSMKFHEIYPSLE
jgi:hypothetical protein